MNIILLFQENQPLSMNRTVSRTRYNDLEYDVSPVQKLTIRLGPYDNSDIIEIERADDPPGEIRVLHHTPDGIECVLSVLEEEV
jgi:hypothetical protein